MLSIFVNLYMFRATMFPSSQETTFFVWYTGAYAPAYQTVIHTKCRLNTAVSPDDGHIVARNV